MLTDHAFAVLDVALMVIGEVENKQVLEIKGFFVMRRSHGFSRF
jgi:hypothetical protein